MSSNSSVNDELKRQAERVHELINPEKKISMSHAERIVGFFERESVSSS